MPSITRAYLGKQSLPLLSLTIRSKNSSTLRSPHLKTVCSPLPRTICTPQSPWVSVFHVEADKYREADMHVSLFFIRKNDFASPSALTTLGFACIAPCYSKLGCVGSPVRLVIAPFLPEPRVTESMYIRGKAITKATPLKRISVPCYITCFLRPEFFASLSLR